MSTSQQWLPTPQAAVAIGCSQNHLTCSVPLAVLQSSGMLMLCGRPSIIAE